MAAFLNHRTEHELGVEGLEALQFSSREVLSDLLEMQAKKRPLKAEMTSLISRPQDEKCSLNSLGGHVM